VVLFDAPTGVRLQARRRSRERWDLWRWLLARWRRNRLRLLEAIDAHGLDAARFVIRNADELTLVMASWCGARRSSSASSLNLRRRTASNTTTYCTPLRLSRRVR